MSLEVNLITWLFGRYVGQDMFGNRYYVSRRQSESSKQRRWVVYHGKAEASKVPPMWHAWLHYVTDEVPETQAKAYEWQKQHEQNLTGTSLAYRPPGHILSGGTRKKATGDYEAWQP